MKKNRSTIILFVVAFGVLILSIAFFASYFLKLNTESEWKIQAKNLSIVLEEQAAQTLFFASLSVDSIADAIPKKNLASQTLYSEYVSQGLFTQILLDKVHTNPLIDVASIADDSGHIINWSRPIPTTSVTIADRSYFQFLKNKDSKQLIFSETVKSKGSGKWVFFAAKRLNAENGTFLGTVQVGISVDRFSDFYQKVVSNIGEGASISLYNDDSSLVTSFPLKEDKIGLKLPSSVKRLILDTGLDSTVAIINYPRPVHPDLPATRIVAPRRVASLPFVVSPTIPDSIYLQSWIDSLQYIWSIALISILLLAYFVRTILNKNRYIEQQNIALDHKVKERTQELEENQIRLKESYFQLAITSRHKSDFMANISHELRTPLNSIIGFSELLSDKAFGDLNAKQSSYIDNIFNSGNHLLELINEILDLSKIEAGEIELIQSDFSLNEVIQSCVSLFSERAIKAKISVKVLSDVSNDEMYADKRKLKVIILYLLSNAIKYNSAGGSVTIKSEHQSEGVTISIADTGIGIDPKDQATIFESFTRLASPYTQTTDGAGLGLAITKRLVEIQGGWLKLQSELGKGSIFTFFIPKQK